MADNIPLYSYRQRFGVIKNRYKDINDGVIPATPIVKKRKRGAARTAANGGEVDSGESVSARPLPPPFPLAKDSMAVSRTRIHIPEEEDVADDGDSIPQKLGEDKEKDEVEEAARTLMAMRNSR
ncbi:uncharacterized protein PG998_010076 [Apiospora kogelbergensis]|uniref:uncharacterized protein n=1 Tax=Apiospora kogelbergensis TaxID=1337665 RepID=UPI00312DB720